MRQDQSAIKKNNQRDCSKNENMIGLPFPPQMQKGWKIKLRKLPKKEKNKDMENGKKGRIIRGSVQEA